MNIGDKLKHLLEENNITISQLAKESGVNAQTIYSMKKRKGNKADSENLAAICKVFGISTDYFYSNNNNQIPNLVLNDDEKKIIKNYRKLDNLGKTLVNDIIEHEMQRINGKKIVIPIAARGKSDLTQDVLVDTKIEEELEHLKNKDD